MIATAHTNAEAEPLCEPPLIDSRRHRVLIADDETAIRLCCRYVLQRCGLECAEANDGGAALAALRERPYDLLLLDIDMPGLTGPQVIREVRADAHYQYLKIILISGRCTADDMAQHLQMGADDFLPKPLSAIQLQARVKNALRLRDAQEKADRKQHDLLRVNAGLEEILVARDSDLVDARNALVVALAKLAESRDRETGAHLMRIQRYCRRLADAARGCGFAEQIDAPFIDMLAGCAPLHDIGKVGIPDRLLLKPGKFDDAERLQMQMHTIIGAETLLAIAEKHRFAFAFLKMAADIARHHHERFDGAGYPDGLIGADIPLEARIVSVCDVYDALRSRRRYKVGVPHARAIEIILSESPGQFDPALLEALRLCESDFEQLYRQTTE